MTTIPPPPLFEPPTPGGAGFQPVSPRDKRTLHHEHCDAVEALTTGAGGAARGAEAERLRRELMRYLTDLGIGTRFQALDFTAWLEHQGLMPDPAVFDARGLGGFFLTLTRGKLIDHLGYRPTGGCAARGINSGARPLYAVRSLDFASIGWGT